MTPENFCYWLQGFFELHDPSKLTEEQVGMIKEHLQLTFNKVTGPYTITSATSKGYSGTQGYSSSSGKSGTTGHSGTC